MSGEVPAGLWIRTPGWSAAVGVVGDLGVGECASIARAARRVCFGGCPRGPESRQHFPIDDPVSHLQNSRHRPRLSHQPIHTGLRILLHQPGHQQRPHIRAGHALRKFEIRGKIRKARRLAIRELGQQHQAPYQ